MTTFQKLTKPLLMAGLLCLALGVADAQDVYIAPTGTLSQHVVGTGESAVDWTFVWDGADWGSTLNGAVFNMASVLSPDAPVVLNLYASGDMVDSLASESLANADFCAQYAGTCGSSDLQPIQFTFGSPYSSMADGSTYIAELTYGGTNAGTYLVGMSGDAGAGLASTPEPATMAMMGGALIALGMFRKRKGLSARP